MQLVDLLGLYGWSSLDGLLMQPGVKSSVTNAMPVPIVDTNPSIPLRPDGKPLGAGCGYVNTDSYVPAVINSVSFASVCEAHDKCYGILGSDKAFCDSQLGNNIVQACNKQLQGIPYAEEVLSSCHMAAGIYQMAVRKLGGDAYNNA